MEVLSETSPVGRRSPTSERANVEVVERTMGSSMNDSPQLSDRFLQVDLTTAPLDVAAFYDSLLRKDCGAVVVFSGTVRDFSEDRTGVLALNYEAYEEPARRRLEAIGYQIFQRFRGVRAVSLVHRLGSMVPTESTVMVGVASHHRGDAFEAARYGIDTLKTSVPIWKQEIWGENVSWGLGASPISEVEDQND